MLSPTRRNPTAALFGALLLLAQGCGQGIFDHTIVSADAGDLLNSDGESPAVSETGIPANSDTGPELGPNATSDAGLDAIPDARTDSGPDGSAIQKIVDDTGAELILDEARLTIGPGTFQTPTLVTLRKLASIDHSGARGPVFEIAVPGIGLFRQVAKLTLQVQSIGANQQYLALGWLDPSQSVAVQQWVPASDSRLSADQTSVTGSVTGFGSASVLQYSAVVSCTTPGVVQCQSGEACNAGACQQCPTGGVCPQ
jgi:hypothetical protein